VNYPPSTGYRPAKVYSGRSDVRSEQTNTFQTKPHVSRTSSLVSPNTPYASAVTGAPPISSQRYTSAVATPGQRAGTRVQSSSHPSTDMHVTLLKHEPRVETRPTVDSGTIEPKQQEPEAETERQEDIMLKNALRAKEMRRLEEEKREEARIEAATRKLQELDMRLAQKKKAEERTAPTNAETHSAPREAAVSSIQPMTQAFDSLTSSSAIQSGVRRGSVKRETSDRGRDSLPAFLEARKSAVAGPGVLLVEKAPGEVREPRAPGSVNVPYPSTGYNTRGGRKPYRGASQGQQFDARPRTMRGPYISNKPYPPAPFKPSVSNTADSSDLGDAQALHAIHLPQLNPLTTTTPLDIPKTTVTNVSVNFRSENKELTTQQPTQTSQDVKASTGVSAGSEKTDKAERNSNAIAENTKVETVDTKVFDETSSKSQGGASLKEVETETAGAAAFSNASRDKRRNKQQGFSGQKKKFPKARPVDAEGVDDASPAAKASGAENQPKNTDNRRRDKPSEGSEEKQTPATESVPTLDHQRRGRNKKFDRSQKSHSGRSANETESHSSEGVGSTGKESATHAPKTLSDAGERKPSGDSRPSSHFQSKQLSGNRHQQNRNASGSAPMQRSELKQDASVSIESKTEKAPVAESDWPGAKDEGTDDKPVSRDETSERGSHPRGRGGRHRGGRGHSIHGRGRGGSQHHHRGGYRNGESDSAASKTVEQDHSEPKPATLSTPKEAPTVKTENSDAHAVSEKSRPRHGHKNKHYRKSGNGQAPPSTTPGSEAAKMSKPST